MESDYIFDVEKFKRMFVEFKNFDDQTILDFSVLTWGRFSCLLEKRSDWEYLWFLSVAHILKLNQNGSVGVVTSANQGSVGVSFDISKMGNDGYWEQTSYGSQFYHALYKKISFRVF